MILCFEWLVVANSPERAAVPRGRTARAAAAILPPAKRFCYVRGATNESSCPQNTWPQESAKNAKSGFAADSRSRPQISVSLRESAAISFGVFCAFLRLSVFCQAAMRIGFNGWFSRALQPAAQQQQPKAELSSTSGTWLRY